MAKPKGLQNMEHKEEKQEIQKIEINEPDVQMEKK